ncbi:MFS transporter [Dictyobacter sp. S3.2.2.5]|uniref:MFS transporter n=1 Tax=Dictyobacter halimunensis TaxID=3026934 RepID=A0ABQ6G6Q4_9CHLR|nr:MFS transporter [Dictyobacter sp. S3.2.2.5]
MLIEQQTAPAPLENRGLHVLGLIAICFGFFMVILDTSVVNVALPAMQHDLHGSLEGLQWVVNGYTLTFASLLLSAGTFGDRLGHKRAFLIGYVLFTGASLLCSLAPSLNMLIAARVLQGVGPALLVPSSLSLITHGFQNPAQRARAVGIWAGSSGIGLAGGPVIGGMLIGALGWRSIFLLNVPLGLLALILTMRFVSERPRTTVRKRDLWGQLCVIVALGTLTYALIEGRSQGWFSTQITSMLLLCVGATGLFLIIEMRHSTPMLPLRLFSSAAFSMPILIGSVLNFGLYGVLFVLSLFFQDIYHYPAVLAGMALLPITVATGLTALLSGRITARLGTRRPMIAGLAASCLGTLLLLWGQTDNAILLLAAGEIAIGLGCGMTVPAMTTAILNAVPRSQVGIASALLNASRQVGGVLGVAILGSLLGSLNEPSAFLAGMRSALLLVALLFLLGSVLTSTTLPFKRK